MRNRTLWTAIDSDRSKWWYYGATVALSCILLGFWLWLWVWSDFDGRGLTNTLKILAFLLPGLALPFMRKRSAKAAVASLGAISLPVGMLPNTTRALHDVLLVTGRVGERHDLRLFTSKSLNAISYEEGKRTVIAVSSTFATLPIEEQRAGLAVLVCRDSASIDPIVLGSKYGIPTDQEGRPYGVADLKDPKVRNKVESSWLEAVAAGDREALLAMREPRAMLILMKRLADSDTRLTLGSLQAAFGCLAWPFDSDFAATAEPGLPLKAREAMAAFSTWTGGSFAPELSRIAHMRSVLPAAERDVPDPEPISPDAAASLFASANASGPSGRRSSPATVLHSMRIASNCPTCGASNVPTNRSCIACGKPIPLKRTA